MWKISACISLKWEPFKIVLSPFCAKTWTYTQVKLTSTKLIHLGSYLKRDSAHASTLRSVSYSGYIKTAGVKSWAPLINDKKSQCEDLFNPRSLPQTHQRLIHHTQYVPALKIYKDKFNSNTANLPALTSVDFTVTHFQGWQALVRQLCSRRANVRLHGGSKAFKKLWSVSLQEPGVKCCRFLQF